MGGVDDAVVLAGGLGSRMLPASLFSSKESLPLIDTPILNHLFWEAKKSGVSRVHLVLSRRKKSVLEEFIEKGTIHDGSVRSDLPRHSLCLGVEGIEVIPHIQEEAMGIGDAISIAMREIDGAFLVLLGDMLLLDKHLGPLNHGPETGSEASLRLVTSFKKTGIPCVGVYPLEQDRLQNYGVVEISEGKVVKIVEKPEIEMESNFVLCGRYLFPENTSELIKKFPVSKYGEMQSISLLEHFISDQGLNSVDLGKMDMYDAGEPVTWLKSQIDHALKRDDIGGEISDWISRRMS